MGLLHHTAEVRVRVYDEAAILVGRLTQEVTFQGNPVNAQLRTTLIVVHQQG